MKMVSVYIRQVNRYSVGQVMLGVGYARSGKGGEVGRTVEGVEQQVCEVGARSWERREGHRSAWRSLMSQVSRCNPHQVDVIKAMVVF